MCGWFPLSAGVRLEYLQEVDFAAEGEQEEPSAAASCRLQSLPGRVESGLENQAGNWFDSPSLLLRMAEVASTAGGVGVGGRREKEVGTNTSCCHLAEDETATLAGKRRPLLTS